MKFEKETELTRNAICFLSFQKTEHQVTEDQNYLVFFEVSAIVPNKRCQDLGGSKENEQ